MKDVIAILLTGIIIKFTDDYLDGDLPESLERGFLPYFLLLFSFSVAISREGTGFFLAAYCVGMLKDPLFKLPIGLCSWQESLVVFLISCGLVGFMKITEAVLIMLVIQIADDIWDFKVYKESWHKNLAARFGIIEAFVSMLIVLVVSLMLNPIKTVFVCVITPVITITYKKIIIKGIG
jgi:hypothetical protein